MKMPTKIKFGTDGWRAIIAHQYTIENLIRVAEGTALWMQDNNMKKLVIGHDCRFGGAMFSLKAAEVFTAYGIEVYRDSNFASTPMVSYGVTVQEADLGVVITASHNPPEYNGFKLKSSYGGPSVPKDIAGVEAKIPDYAAFAEGSVQADLSLIKDINLEDIYVEHLVKNFDLDAIRNSGVRVAYDAMFGAGQNVIRRIMPEAFLLNCEYNPSFKGQAPEPIHKNLATLSQLTQSIPDATCGLATDGDADRIGMYDEHGQFVDSHHLLLLLLYFLGVEKGLKGKVVVTFSVTEKMEKLAKMLNLDFQVTKIGFKHIAEIMIEEDVIVGGEESGGLAIKGFIPERDGIWIGLTIMEFMAKSGKTLSELVKMIHEKVGEFYFDRDDLHIPEETKLAIIARCAAGLDRIGDMKVTRVETIDGFKFHFNDGEWVMIRPSGTEPLLRVYAQATSEAKLREILDTTHQFFKA